MDNPSKGPTPSVSNVSNASDVSEPATVVPSSVRAATPATPATPVQAVSPAPAASGDRALILGALPDGGGMAILRKRSEDAPLEAGVVKPLQEGAPIHGEVVKLTPRPEAPSLCDVTVQYGGAKGEAPAKSNEPAAEAGSRKGPPKVSSEPYRAGWDRIFGAARKTDYALN